MRLLVIANHFLPDRGGGGAVYSDMCFALAARGVEITVFCPYPFYPEWTDKSHRNGFHFWRYRQNGVDVVRYGFVIPKNPRSLSQRLVFEASLLLSLLRLVPGARRFDAVMVYCPYFSAVVIAGLIRFLFRQPLWLNVQDVATDAAKATGMIRSQLAAAVLAAVERVFYNRAGIWSTISPVMIKKLEPLRRRGQPILFLPNWVDAELSEALASRPPRSRSKGPIQMLYAGNIGGKQNLIDLCRALHDTNVPFRFRVFGSGGDANELEAWVSTAKDDRFSFGPFLDAGRLAEELTKADLYVITEKTGVGESFFPSKLVTGMAAGTPILAICDSTSPLGMEMILAAPGLQVRWADLASLPSLLNELAANPSRLSQWQTNALARAAFYDREAIVDWLKATLEGVIAGKNVEARPHLGEIPAQD